jgi:hypothetical protein
LKSQNDTGFHQQGEEMRTFLKSLLVGVVYVLALVIGGVIARVVGLSLPEVKDVLTKTTWSFVGGVIAGPCLGSLATSMPASRARHLIVWGSVIFLNLASIAIEGYFFVPEVIGDTLPGLLVQQFIASATMGWAITALFAPNDSSVPDPAIHRSVFSWLWRFPLSALTYVFFYFIFGAANYMLVTKPYYETHAGGLAVPPLNVTLTAEVIRGALIMLSILPFLLTRRADKKQLAVQTGFILFAIGGLFPLTLQVGVLPFFLLAASAVEIFFQNFSAGVVIALLLGIENSRGATK